MNNIFDAHAVQAAAQDFSSFDRYADAQESAHAVIEDHYADAQVDARAAFEKSTMDAVMPARPDPATAEELAQVIGNFQALGAYGRRCALAMLAGLVRLGEKK